MSSNFKMNDYVDVSERIRQFYEKYPDGRLTSGAEPRVVDIGGKPYIWYHARAFRTPDDQLPGDGWAAEPVPGPTQFTRDSELMNAETAAWGRAIVALGFETKKIASAQEVRARQDTRQDTPAPGETGESASEAQQKKLRVIVAKLVKAGEITQAQIDSAAGGKFVPEKLTKKQASALIERLERYEQNLTAAA